MHAIGTINRRDFDGARLGDLVRKYVEGEIHLVVQIHDLGDKLSWIITTIHDRRKILVDNMIRQKFKC